MFFSLKNLISCYLPNGSSHSVKLLPLIIHFVEIHLPERDLDLTHRVVLGELVIIPHLQNHGFPGNFHHRDLLEEDDDDDIVHTDSVEHFDDFRRRKSGQNEDFRGRFYAVA